MKGSCTTQIVCQQLTRNETRGSKESEVEDRPERPLIPIGSSFMPWTDSAIPPVESSTFHTHTIFPSFTSTHHISHHTSFSLVAQLTGLQYRHLFYLPSESHIESQPSIEDQALSDQGPTIERRSQAVQHYSQPRIPDRMVDYPKTPLPALLSSS